jgi:DNA mismatch repair protein MutL
VIRILEDRVVNRIAAGEVVARPASALKELVENSLDAGAHDLRIALRAGGRSLIQVVDDGCGMSPDDATMCLERHATSKIRAFEDLEEVRTLGFRGEALPSIAAVSRFELVTRRHSDDAAVRVDVEGGRILAVEAAGAPQGTRISVRSLFFNVPARRKFLRTVPTELGHCLEAITRMALVHPEVDFEVTHNGSSALRAPRAEDRAARAAQLLGAHGRALVPAQFSDADLTVDALVSPVGVHRGSARGSTYLYVNGRFVQDMVVRRAVTEAYRGIVPKGRFPAQVDVNVHPAKTEVRFRNARQIARVIAEGVREALEDHGIQRAPVSTSVPLVRPAPAPRPPARPVLTNPEPPRPSALPDPSLSSGWVARPLPEPPAPVVPAEAPYVPDSIAAEPTPVQAFEPHPPALDFGALLPVPRFADLRVIGQVARTYILTEGAGELVIIDQHAAHERVTLHRLQQGTAAHPSAGQRLLSPVLVELSAGQARALEPQVDLLATHGLEVTPFGDRTFAIQQVPAVLAGADPVRLVTDLADDFAEGGTGRPIAAIREKALATMACHTSIRAGQALSPYEMRELLRSLDHVDFSVCAHGRPVCIRVPPGELERRFHRS